MSEPERSIDVPYEHRGGVWANDVDVFGDVQEATLDFLRIDRATPEPQLSSRR